MLSISRNQTQSTEQGVKYDQSHIEHKYSIKTKYYARSKSVAWKTGFGSRSGTELNTLSAFSENNDQKIKN